MRHLTPSPVNVCERIFAMAREFFHKLLRASSH
jgi:hypothetical protein